MMNKLCAVILAAGQGSRFGEKKQFLQFNGKELWKHVYDKTLKVIDKEDVVVVGVDVNGGATRSGSVLAGLEFLSARNKQYDRVLILEAARPLVTVDQIKRIADDFHISATYSLPLVNTVIKKDGTYLDRNDYLFMTTPAAFNFDLLLNAFKSGKYVDLTDDTRVMYEEYGIKPFFLEGGENLIKLTYKSDLSIIEMLSKKYGD